MNRLAPFPTGNLRPVPLEILRAMDRMNATLNRQRTHEAFERLYHSTLHSMGTEPTYAQNK